jgi:ubiquinone/menaquinone biosynthesis C-methylase UbiE
MAAQFMHPRGLLGRLAGRLMAEGNLEPARWLVDELLGVGVDDRFLDVGCGPGTALALAADRATCGWVVGVDDSDVMVAQARTRTRGRMSVVRARAEQLPFVDASFTRVGSANSVPFWDSPGEGLLELHRVLRPTGVVAVVVRMFRPDAGRFSPSRYGFRDADLADLSQRVRAAEFSQVSVSVRAFTAYPPETLAGICGVSSHSASEEVRQ